MNNGRSKIKSFLVKATIFIGIVVLAFISVGIYKEMSQKKQIQSQIQQLQQEAQQITHDNALTQERIAYQNSADYQQKEAKDNLNLQSPGENTVIVKPTVAPDVPAPIVADASAPVVPPQVPNQTKWWDYFFKY